MKLIRIWLYRNVLLVPAFWRHIRVYDVVTSVHLYVANTRSPVGVGIHILIYIMSPSYSVVLIMLAWSAGNVGFKFHRKVEFL